MGSLSLLQGIFPTQESNLGLLHCRQILYQQSYPRSFPYKKLFREMGVGCFSLPSDDAGALGINGRARELTGCSPLPALGMEGLEGVGTSIQFPSNRQAPWESFGFVAAGEQAPCILVPA